MHMVERRKRKRLEARRQRAVSEIRGERATFETMVKRAQINGAVTDESIKAVPHRFEEVERKAREAKSIEELDDLVDDAKSLGQLRAYICPPAEVADEGTLTIDVMEEWGVPRETIGKLRASVGQKVGSKDVTVTRGALRAIFEEFDSWSAYIEDYEEVMQRSAKILLWVIGGLSLLAILALHFPKIALVGLLFAGATGGCVSVVARMPMLDVSPSVEFAAYRRRILTRISTGAIASLIGCALLGWGLLPISIQNQTFADLLNVCTVSPSTSCTELKILILLGVSMVFGFSERALTSFEYPVLGNSGGRRPSRMTNHADSSGAAV